MESINKNNKEINEKIKIIIGKMKSQKIPTFEKREGVKQLTEIAEKILTMEKEKILATYRLEFFEYYDNKEKDEVKISIVTPVDRQGNEIKELDAHGYKGGIEFCSTTSLKLEELEKQELRYRINQKGKLRYDPNGEKLPLEDSKFQGMGLDMLLDEGEKVENDLEMTDYLLCCKMDGRNDLEFFLDVMPHELMHSFGFSGGIFEGEQKHLQGKLLKSMGYMLYQSLTEKKRDFFKK